MPLQHAAAALVDLRKAPPTIKIVHLIHPRSISWSSISSVISSELKVPLVPYAEWLTRLERFSSQNRNGNGSQDATQIRALQLLPFYRAIFTMHRGESMGFSKLSSSNLLNVVDAALPQLNDVDVKQWLAYWRGAGLLSNARV